MQADIKSIPEFQDAFGDELDQWLDELAEDAILYEQDKIKAEKLWTKYCVYFLDRAEMFRAFSKAANVFYMNMT
jgi:hypothetical protein